LRDGDLIEIAYEGMGRPLHNTIHWVLKEKHKLVAVEGL